MARITKGLLEKQLEALRTGPTDASAETGVFIEKCRAWLQSNQDGRGTTSAAIRDAFHGAVRFRQALNARHHSDPSTKRIAAKVVTAARHESFPELLERLRTLHGRLSKAGRRMAERRRQDAERIIELDEEFELRELRSVQSLQRVGVALRNCVARQSCAREYLGDRDVEMWALFERADERPRYLVRVDRSTKEIDEFEGHDGSTPNLERHLALRMLSTLGVSGDEQESFATAGAFHVFLDGQPTVDPIEINQRRYWIWSLRGGTELIIAIETRSGQRWSRFLRRGTPTVNHPRWRRRRKGFVGGSWNHLSEGELLALALDHPALAERLRDGENDKEPEESTA